MEFEELGISGAWIAHSSVYNDDRGFFREWFKAADVLAATGVEFEIQQANISQSQRGVIRGIHYSLAPQGQAKWITCANGHVLDVIVDIPVPAIDEFEPEPPSPPAFPVPPAPTVIV